MILRKREIEREREREKKKTRWFSIKAPSGRRREKGTKNELIPFPKERERKFTPGEEEKKWKSPKWKRGKRVAAKTQQSVLFSWHIPARSTQTDKIFHYYRTNGYDNAITVPKVKLWPKIFLFFWHETVLNPSGFVTENEERAPV